MHVSELVAASRRGESARTVFRTSVKSFVSAGRQGDVQGSRHQQLEGVDTSTLCVNTGERWEKMLRIPLWIGLV